jgi:hypothetical protein
VDTPLPPSVPAEPGPSTIAYRRPNARTTGAPAPDDPPPPSLPSISDYWPDAPHRLDPRAGGGTRIVQHPQYRAGEPDAAAPAPAPTTRDGPGG